MSFSVEELRAIGRTISHASVAENPRKDLHIAALALQWGDAIGFCSLAIVAALAGVALANLDFVDALIGPARWLLPVAAVGGLCVAAVFFARTPDLSDALAEESAQSGLGAELTNDCLQIKAPRPEKLVVLDNAAFDWRVRRQKFWRPELTRDIALGLRALIAHRPDHAQILLLRTIALFAEKQSGLAKDIALALALAADAQRCARNGVVWRARGALYGLAAQHLVRAGADALRTQRLLADKIAAQAVSPALLAEAVILAELAADDTAIDAPNPALARALAAPDIVGFAPGLRTRLGALGLAAAAAPQAPTPASDEDNAARNWFGFEPMIDAEQVLDPDALFDDERAWSAAAQSHQNDLHIHEKIPKRDSLMLDQVGLADFAIAPPRADANAALPSPASLSVPALLSAQADNDFALLQAPQPMIDEPRAAVNPIEKKPKISLVKTFFAAVDQSSAAIRAKTLGRLERMRAERLAAKAEKTKQKLHEPEAVAQKTPLVDPPFAAEAVAPIDASSRANALFDAAFIGSQNEEAAADLAMAEAQRAFENAQQAQSLLQQANAALHESDFENAEALGLKARALQPTSAGARLVIGSAKIERENAEGLDDLIRAVELDPRMARFAFPAVTTFLQENPDIANAGDLRARVQDLSDDARRASLERETPPTLSETFVPAALDAYAKIGISNSFARNEDIVSAAIVRRITKHWCDLPAFLVAIKLRAGWSGETEHDEQEAADRLQRAVAAVSAFGSTCVVAPTNWREHVAAWRIFRTKGAYRYKRKKR